MTWKSTAAASGVMLVTWLASHAPVGRPREQPSTTPSAARTETAAAQIQREADRLHARLQRVAAYKTPARNPFRFGAHPDKVSPLPPAPAPVVEPAPIVDPQPPTLRVRLSGIGEDLVDDQVVRTAIISTPDNVHLVKTGDTLVGVYKVTKIDATAVDLVRLDDGSVVTLTLRP